MRTLGIHDHYLSKEVLPINYRGVNMLEQNFFQDDFQISYSDTISAIRLLFNDKIKECSEGYHNTQFIEALKEMREEFADDFKMTVQQVLHQKHSK